MKTFILSIILIFSASYSFAVVQPSGTLMDNFCSTQATSNEETPLETFCFAIRVGSAKSFVTFTYPEYLTPFVGEVINSRPLPVEMWSTHTETELTVLLENYIEIKMVVSSDTIDPSKIVVKGESPLGTDFTAWDFEIIFHPASI